MSDMMGGGGGGGGTGGGSMAAMGGAMQGAGGGQKSSWPPPYPTPGANFPQPQQQQGFGGGQGGGMNQMSIMPIMQLLAMLGLTMGGGMGRGATGGTSMSDQLRSGGQGSFTPMSSLLGGMGGGYA